MVEAKHTPGPWRVEDGTTLIWGACNPDDNSTWGMGYPVADARTQLGHGSPLCRSFREDEAVANAHLIAAAPELLEYAEQVLIAWEKLAAALPYDARIEAIEFEQFNKLRSAVAKAIGLQPWDIHQHLAVKAEGRS